MQQDQGKLALHVSGLHGDGKVLVAYCIQAGMMTVWMVQALDYAGRAAVRPRGSNSG